MRSLLKLSSLGLLVVVGVLPAAAGVKLKVLEDGTRVMYNDGPARHRRTQPPSRAVSRLSEQEINHLVGQHSRQQGLDPDLVKAVIQVESAYRPAAVSHKGAMGLMQLMPATAQSLAVRDPWDPDQNVQGGTRYLRYLMDLFGGQLELVLAGYNAGPEAVNRYGGVPPFDETRNYVEKVLRIYRGEQAYTLPASARPRIGRRTYLTRDANGQYVMTTSPRSDR